VPYTRAARAAAAPQAAIEVTSLEEAGAKLETNFFGLMRMMNVVLPRTMSAVKLASLLT
jgi:hypothetical protein